MDDGVSVAVNFGSDIRTMRFSRVPAVGECIKIYLPHEKEAQLYIVRSVIHTPNSAQAAEIAVSLRG